MDKLLGQINLETPPKKVLEIIAHTRERKYESEKTLKLIEKAVEMTHDYIVNLYFERAHIYQHIYMTERDKLGKGHKKRMVKGLKKMEKFTRETGKYIRENKLGRWLHRIYRFYGKIEEYKRNYNKAVNYYRKSLKYWRTDPEVVREGLPRNLELSGFLASALIMSGKSKTGLKLAKSTYGKYETTKERKALKKKDYTTWAIWRTGCAIYAARGLLEGKVKIDKKLVLDWLTEAEKFLNPPKSVKVWADFQFRKDEIKALKKLLD